MESIRKLEEIFARFPGIGPRQARRFVYHLLNKSNASVDEFITLIKEVRGSSAECSRCHRFYTNSREHTASTMCSTCLDSSRDQNTLMVVARDSDFEAIEKSVLYKGLYFIIGGTVPVFDTDPEKKIRLRSLLEHISNSSNMTEIILSMNTTPDGEHTTSILKHAIKKILEGRQAKITILGRGLSTGAELEYADSETIRNALNNRS